LTPQWQERAKELGITLAQGVTIASLIGRETGYSEEKTLVSAVFHNRLRRKMRLQSDPTAIYGLEPWDGKVRKKDLLRDTPYNTYLISGLPPGPIANPGWDSLDAALHPAAVDYLYFVSKNDGSHVFSSHLKAHQEAVLKYQISKQKQ
jgi:UPF0755 protein